MKNKIITIVLSIIAIWSIMFLVDCSRCNNDKEPIFSIKVAEYKDGGSIKYVGAFYNYYRVRTTNSNSTFGEECSDLCFLTDYVITPWFYDLTSAKEKL